MSKEIDKIEKVEDKPEICSGAVAGYNWLVWKDENDMKYPIRFELFDPDISPNKTIADLGFTELSELHWFLENITEALEPVMSPAVR